MLTFLCPFSGLGERSQNGAPQGGGHAIRSRRRMFREGRPSSLRLHFGLHFGVVLGAKFATILPFGRPGGQNRVAKEGLKKEQKERGGQRSPRYPKGPPPPPAPAEPPRRTP